MLLKDMLSRVYSYAYASKGQRLLDPGASFWIGLLSVLLFWVVQPVQFAASTFWSVLGQKHKEMETVPTSGAEDCIHLLSLWENERCCSSIQLTIKELSSPPACQTKLISGAGPKKNHLECTWYFCIPTEDGKLNGSNPNPEESIRTP